MDIRLNKKSQLAGFAKKDDLKVICGIEYVLMPRLAPTNKATYHSYCCDWA
ncbi:MAG: hypothetical protein DRR08_21140 [Candidatus Parabeggiatoa sp. nov. 2]|nr:MAG: hypothetical protein DRR08_21140 [Gammaproteobacteria bacterium]